MKAEIKGDELIIRAPLGQLRPSRSGNTLVLASSKGNRYAGEYKGKPVNFQLNVFTHTEELEGTGEGQVMEEEQRKPVRRVA